MISEFWIVFVTSVKPMMPFLDNNPNSVISFPSMFLVSVAAGKIFIPDLSLPLLKIKSTIDTLSIAGLVFGIETTDVTPPDSAALLKLLKFSLYSKPGSPTKTFISTIPGIKTLLFKSIFSDFDGIFSPNVPQEVCEDEDKYIEYISTVEPFYHRIPKTKCAGIVTARLEKYRGITEKWLKKHDINYGFLEMYPTEKKDIRDKNHVEESSTFKAEIFKRSSAKFFIESEVSEAVRIREKSGKFVICPEEKDG